MTGHGRFVVPALALSTGLSTVAAGWSLPVPLGLRLVAGLLATGTAWGLLSVLVRVVAAVAGVLRGGRPRPVLVGVALVALVADGTGRVGTDDATPGPAVDVVAALATAPPPTPVVRSGDPGSLLDRRGLGPEGRVFVDADRTATGAARVYAGVVHAADEADRVQLAVEEWVRLGGLERSVVLVAAPTGSGWVDGGAVAAAERAAGGDVATVVVQYATRASALEYVLDGDRSARVTTAVVRGLRAVLDARPADQRPQLVLFGESLGADAVEQAAAAVDVDGCLAVGAPGGAVRPERGSECVTVRNADDPVSSWSPRVLLVPPVGRPWLPVVTFWQATAEMAVSLDQPPGHGHSYGASLEPVWAQLLGDRVGAGTS